MSALALNIAGCATRSSVTRDYQTTLHEEPQLHRGGSTTVFILIDGLPLSTLQRMHAEGRLPAITEHFLSQPGQSIGVGHSVFPSLTFPNISSFLTHSRVDQHHVIGNHMLASGETIDLENPLEQDRLNTAIHSQTLFSELARQSGTSASFSHAFRAGATASYDTDPAAGVRYALHDYAAIDAKMLDSLDQLINRTPPGSWPEFVFVHLVGLDGVSHRSGPYTPQAMRAMETIDAQLAPALARLRQAEADGKPVVTVLSSDHGFIDVRKSARAPLAPPAGARVITEARYSAIYYDATVDEATRARQLGEWLRDPAVDATVLKVAVPGSAPGSGGGELILRTRTGSSRLVVRSASCGFAVSIDGAPFACPAALDAGPRQVYQPYFVTNIAAYFRDGAAPDAIVLAAPGVSFTSGTRGEHGGATPDEVLIPLLARGARPGGGAATGSPDVLSFVPAYAAAKVAHAPGGFGAASSHTSLPMSFEFDVGTRAQVTQIDAPLGTYRSQLGPGLDVEIRQNYEGPLGALVAWRADYTRFPRSAAQTSELLHEVELGASYRFAPRRLLVLVGGAAEEFFPATETSVATGASSLALQKHWVPQGGFGTRFRLIATSVGDVSVRSTLSLLFPTDASQTHAGLRTQNSLYFDTAAGARMGTRTGFWLGIENQIQKASAPGVADRQLMILGAGFFYGMGID